MLRDYINSDPAMRYVKPLLEHEVARAAAALGDDAHGDRDRALLLLGFAGAFRACELVALNVSDLEVTTSGLRVLVSGQLGPVGVVTRSVWPVAGKNSQPSCGWPAGN